MLRWAKEEEPEMQLDNDDDVTSVDSAVESDMSPRPDEEMEDVGEFGAAGGVPRRSRRSRRGTRRTRSPLTSTPARRTRWAMPDDAEEEEGEGEGEEDGRDDRVLGKFGGSETAAGVTVTSHSKRDRLLMRPWLVKMANTRQIPHVEWHDMAHTQIRIPWKHGSRSCWTLDDCALYREWARHTGKLAESSEPKRWKANFRCALNSLPDVKQVKLSGQQRGVNPYKVYQLLEETDRKAQVKKARRGRRPGSKQQVNRESSKFARSKLHLANVTTSSNRSAVAPPNDRLPSYSYWSQPPQQQSRTDSRQFVPVTSSSQLTSSNVTTRCLQNSAADNGSFLLARSLSNLSTDSNYFGNSSPVIPTVVEELSDADFGDSFVVGGPSSSSSSVEESSVMTSLDNMAVAGTLYEVESGSLEEAEAVSSYELVYRRSTSMSSNGSGSYLTDDSGFPSDSILAEPNFTELLCSEEIYAEDTTSYMLSSGALAESLVYLSAEDVQLALPADLL